MNRDNNDEYPGQEKQLGFEEQSFEENPRQLEPLFDDLKDHDDTIHDALEQLVDDSPPTPTGYQTDYDENTIDYDVDPDALILDEDEDEPEYDFDGGEQAEPRYLEEEEVTAEATIAPAAHAEPAIGELASFEQDTEEGEEVQEEDDTWDVEEQDYYDSPDNDGGGPLPLGLIAIAVVALILLGAGGYGVMQQRSAMQEEIRVLQSSIAMSMSPEEVAQAREDLQLASARNTELQATVDSMQGEIRALTDTNRSLEAQVAEIQAQASKRIASLEKAAKAKPAPKPAPAPTPTPKASSSAKGNWFVNFGSYGQRETAQSWANRLQPGKGNVVVAPGSRDGRTFYRVRVVGLSSKGQAQLIATDLEQQFDLSQLWIGQE